MLTRLQVSGFKNLVDVDVSFGPFSCIAGPNGVGKSNLFDAIRFLSALADRPIIEAALRIRDEEDKTADVSSLFHRVGNMFADEMTFAAEMLIAPAGVDEFGVQAKATKTFLRYELSLALRRDNGGESRLQLEIIKEELKHKTVKAAHEDLRFPNAKVWRDSVIQGTGGGAAFISTERLEGKRVIKFHTEDGSSLRPIVRRAADLPRTILSSANTAGSPTALLVRREMQSWRLLQLEPSALRKPDPFTATPELGSDGSHLPSTILRLANPSTNGKVQEEVYARIANRLAELIEDVQTIKVDRDEQRGLLTVQVLDEANTWHPACALSDGTLRFLALAVLELDPKFQGLVCLEEPENGIHPERIPAIVKLLEDIAVDPQVEVGDDNPLRQVIINTHSPAVVTQVDDTSLLVAEPENVVRNGHHFRKLSFACLPNTWRADKSKENAPMRVLSMGKLLAYLNPAPPMRDDSPSEKRAKRRVVDRPDVRQMLFPYARDDS